MAILSRELILDELPQGDRNPIPEGWYQAVVTKTEVKPTKNGTGEYITVWWQITGPSRAGAMVFDRINVKNDSQRAEEIGQAQIGSLLRAVGMNRLKNTDELLGRPCGIKVVITEDPGYDPTNEVKAYKASDAVAGSPQIPAMPKLGGMPQTGSKATGVSAPSRFSTPAPQAPKAEIPTMNIEQPSIHPNPAESAPWNRK